MAKAVTLDPADMKALRSLSRRKKVSMAGLVGMLVQMADAKRSDLGIIDLDWEKMRNERPALAERQKKTWNAVMVAVAELAKEFNTAEEIAMHSRFTVPQVKRALEELAK